MKFDLLSNPHKHFFQLHIFAVKNILINIMTSLLCIICLQFIYSLELAVGFHLVQFHLLVPYAIWHLRLPSNQLNEDIKIASVAQTWCYSFIFRFIFFQEIMFFVRFLLDFFSNTCKYNE